MDPLVTLGAAAGRWHGQSTLHDPIRGAAEVTDSTVTLTPLLGGRFARLDYTWSYQGEPQEGSLLIGHRPKAGVVSAHWIDSWHMGRDVLACTGTVAADGSIAVRGSYPAPTGPDWGWRITVRATPDTLTITHTNIEPEGAESPAVESSYTRA